MARAARGTLSIRLALTELLTLLGVGASSGQLPHPHEFVREMETGTGNGQIDRVWSTASGSVVAASPVSVDLSGALASVLDSGQTVVMADLQVLMVENTSTSGNLILGAHANNVGFVGGAASGSIIIPPGGCFCIDLGTAGLAIGAGATDIVQLDASAGTVTYKLTVGGRSA